MQERMARLRTQDFYERYWNVRGELSRHHARRIDQCKLKLKRALVDIPIGLPVLDAGCGQGVFSLFMLDLGYKVFGIDISYKAVRDAARTISDGYFGLASLEDGLPFKEGYFAAVWCSEVMEHIFDVYGVLAELNRVLARHGMLVLTTPYHGFLKNLAIALTGFEKHYNPNISHIRFFTRKSLADCLGGAGFEIVKCNGVGRWKPFWMSHFVVSRKISMPLPSPEITG